MHFIKAIQVLGLSSMLIALGHAEKTAVPEAVITYTNTYDSNQLVKNACQAILDLDKSALKLFSLVIDTITMDNAPEFDALFQANKYKLAKKIQKHTLSLPNFSNINEVMTIHIHDDGMGHPLKFNLYNLVAVSMILNTWDIRTQEEAIIALDSVQKILTSIDNMLPSDLKEGLEPFRVVDEEIPLSFTNQITLLHYEDSRRIIKSLVAVKQHMRSDLIPILHLAQLAVKDGLTENERLELDDDYRDKTSNFRSKLYTDPNYQIQTNIPIYHDIKLNFRLKDQIYTYFFPNIDLTTLQLDSDHLLDISSAITAYKHLSLTYIWLTTWIVTGTTLLSEVSDEAASQQNLSNILSALDKSGPQKALFLEKINNAH